MHFIFKIYIYHHFLNVHVCVCVCTHDASEYKYHVILFLKHTATCSQNSHYKMLFPVAQALSTEPFYLHMEKLLLFDIGKCNMKLNFFLCVCVILDLN